MVASYKENSGSKNSWASIYFVSRVLLDIGNLGGENGVRRGSRNGTGKKYVEGETQAGDWQGAFNNLCAS